MEKENLRQTLAAYENELQIDTLVKGNDTQTIKNDLNRTDFTFSDVCRSKVQAEFYTFILQQSFIDFKLTYYQGMMEIATVMIDAYFSDLAEMVGDLYGNKDDLNKEKREFKRIVLDKTPKKTLEHFEAILKKHADLFRKYKNALVNVLQKKFIAFTFNNFEKYNKLNAKFVQMMNSNMAPHVKHPESQLNDMLALKYMNHTLTFFKRLSGNSGVIFTIFNLILNSDLSIVFCILAYYIDQANRFTGSNAITSESEMKKYLISEVSESDIKKILKIHDSFLKNKYLKKKSNIFINGLILGVVLGIFAYFCMSVNKNK